MTSTQPYLSVLNGSDLNNFQIDFTEANAFEPADIGVQTVNYDVEITEYAGIATVLSGSTTLEVLCAIDLSSYNEEVGYSVSTQTLDLLSNVSPTVRMPTLAFTPNLCIFVTWKIFRRSDSKEVSATMSQVFNVGATELTVTHSSDNFSSRKNLFGDHNREFYWKGFLNDRALTTTSEFPFEFIF